MMAESTRDAPTEIKRKTREKVLCNNSLFDAWESCWSDWVLAMTPRYHVDFRARKTEEYQDRPGYKITKAALQREFEDERDEFSCGIYEWKARSSGTGIDYKGEFVVYVGCTCRGKKGNFIDRINEYCINGSHKADYINDALTKGYQLWVRFKGSGDDGIAHDGNKECAEWDENKVLKYYDYAWNIRSVKQYDRTVP